jgi:hypothetical protein
VRLAGTWVYRPWLKGIGLTAAAILLLVISGYLVKAVDSLTVRLAGKR